MIGGVAAGLGEFFDIDPTIVRLVFLFLSLFNGAGLVLYLIGWVIIPPAPMGEPSPAFERTERIREQVIESAKDLEAQWRGEHAESSPADKENRAAQNRQLLGWILVIVGVLALAHRFLDFSYLWPLVLIALGILVIAQSMRR